MMYDLSKPDPIDLGFNDVLEDSCNYVDLSETELYPVSPDSLNMIQLNARGVLGKQDQIKLLLKELRKTCNLHAAFLVETWLTNKNTKRFKIPGYNFIGCHRKCKQGGGVGILLAQHLEYRERPDLKLSAPDFETVVIELKTSGDSIMLCSMYRPPNSNVKEFVKNYQRFLGKFTPKQMQRLIIGLDHNLNLLKHDQHTATHDFIEVNLEKDLMPTTTKPTRITRSTATLIDNIIIGSTLQANYDSNIIISDLSDHFPCFLSIGNQNLFKKKPKIITTRALNTKKLEEINTRITNIDWNIELDVPDVNIQYNKFQNKILEILDDVSPYHTVRIPHNKILKDPWITNGLMKCLKKQKQLYRHTLKGSSTESDIIRYRTYRNKLKSIVRRNKEVYFKDKCSEYRKNTSRLWKMINKLLNKSNDKTNIIDYLKVDNQDYYEDKVIAEEFAKHFSSVGPKYANQIPTPNIDINQYLNQIKPNPQTMFTLPTTSIEIEKLISSLPNKRSSGQDNISNILLKQLKGSLKKPLEIIFNNSMKHGVFPHGMKHADVTPLYKAKEHYLVTNYRPISLLVTISKVLKKIIYSRTYKFLTSTEQLYSGQYGFRSGHSCQNAVTELIGNIQKNLEENKTSIGVFIDLSKAFDTLDHKLLLKKLEIYGIRGIALSWFQSYLENRTIRVKIQTEKGQYKYSDQHTITYGTPQGSCLGPLLFLVFINDLPNNVNYGMSLLFADDTTLLHSHSNLRYLKWTLEDDLNRLMDWFKANKLTLNLDKTVCVMFSKSQSQKPIKLNIGDYEIMSTENVKLLGMWIDKDLNWNKQLSTLHIKLKQNTQLLRNSKKFMTKETLKILYYAHIYSHITYGLVLWGNMVSTVSLNSLQKIQNTCFSLITNLSPTLENYKQEKILKLQQLLTLENNKIGYQMDKALLPSNVSDLLWTDSRNKSLKKPMDIKQGPNTYPNFLKLLKQNIIKVFN